jgi:hypothetical protein
MKKREKKPNVNLIFSHVNHIFFILGFQIRPQALDTLIVPYEKCFF